MSLYLDKQSLMRCQIAMYLEINRYMRSQLGTLDVNKVKNSLTLRFEQLDKIQNYCVLELTMIKDTLKMHNKDEFVCTSLPADT